MIKNFISNKSGATAIEYGLIAGLIALVIIAAVQTTGTTLLASFNNIATQVR
jgi:pilus assembly protein Flp/PilA